MTTHSSVLAWRIPMDRGAWQATVYGVTELDTTEQLSKAQAWERSSVLGKQYSLFLIPPFYLPNSHMISFLAFMV